MSNSYPGTLSWAKNKHKEKKIIEIGKKYEIEINTPSGCRKWNI